MQASEKSLKNLLQTLPPRPIEKHVLDEAVSKALEEAGQKSTQENRRTQWEYVLRNEVYTLAAKEGTALNDPSTTYYDDLQDILDVILSFTQQDACEPIFPFNILYELLETQTIASCSHIFSWIEERADHLTEGMVPQKGKALVLLRTLNDLLRRLSKMGSTTKFCGRILTFLSRVFPLGERSGVNLRGEYGPTWEGPGADKWDASKPESSPKVEEDKMQVDESKTPSASQSSVKDEAKDDFYRVFWSLQLPFSRPVVFAESFTLPKFKEAVNKILPVIKEATAKERALMGSKAVSGSSLKRKREPELHPDPNSNNQDYFFAKYLTSPDLLDLEIADTHFRRQFIFQLLICLHHLLTFTKSAKEQWITPRNRSLQIDFTLEADDTQWVEDTIKRASEELRQTAPNGRQFAETIRVLLEREKNWIKWKNELCNTFDRDAWSVEVDDEDEQGRKVKRRIGLQEATLDVRKGMRADPPEWEHRYGSAPLTEIWEMGYRGLHDLQRPFQSGSIHDFVKKIKQEDARIDLRKKQLQKQAERAAQARTKAAAAAAVKVKEVKEVKEKEVEEVVAAPIATPASNTTEAPSSSTPRSLPAPSTSLQHPLPAKPGSAPSKPPSQDNTAASTTSAPASTPAPTPAPAPALPPAPAPQPAPEPVPEPDYAADEMIRQYEENKVRWSWLALRTARDVYLNHLGKIGTGDVLQLQQEIEKEARDLKEREERFRRGEVQTMQEDQGAGSGMIPVASLGNMVGEAIKTEPHGKEEQAQANGRDAEDDVKMDGPGETASS